MTYNSFYLSFPTRRKKYFRLSALWQWLIFVAMSGTVSVPSHASTSAANQASVTTFVEQSVAAFARSVGSKTFTVTVAPFDVPDICEAPVDMTLSDPHRPVGRFTVTLTCEQPKYWKARVKAEAAVFVNVVVAKSPLKRGQSIQFADLAMKEVDIAYIRHGYFTDPENLIGNQLRRNISPGRILTPKQIDRPLWVTRDQEVIIEARRGKMIARMKGVALESGSEGDIVRVKNSSSEKVIQATVSSPGTVTTAF